MTGGGGIVYYTILYREVIMVGCRNTKTVGCSCGVVRYGEAGAIEKYVVRGERKAGSNGGFVCGKGGACRDVATGRIDCGTQEYE